VEQYLLVVQVVYAWVYGVGVSIVVTMGVFGMLYYGTMLMFMCLECKFFDNDARKRWLAWGGALMLLPLVPIIAAGVAHELLQVWLLQVW